MTPAAGRPCHAIKGPVTTAANTLTAPPKLSLTPMARPRSAGLGMIGDEGRRRDIGRSPAEPDEERPERDGDVCRRKGDKASANERGRDAGNHDGTAADAVGELAEWDRECKHSDRVKHMRERNRSERMTAQGRVSRAPS